MTGSLEPIYAYARGPILQAILERAEQEGDSADSFVDWIAEQFADELANNVRELRSLQEKAAHIARLSGEQAAMRQRLMEEPDPVLEEEERHDEWLMREGRDVWGL